MNKIINKLKTNLPLTILLIGILVVFYFGYDLFNMVQSKLDKNISSQPTFDIIGKYFNQ